VFYGGQTHQKDRFLSLRRCLKLTYSNVEIKIFSGLTPRIPVSGEEEGGERGGKRAREEQRRGRLDRWKRGGKGGKEGERKGSREEERFN